MVHYETDPHSFLAVRYLIQRLSNHTAADHGNPPHICCESVLMCTGKIQHPYLSTIRRAWVIAWMIIIWEID